MVVLSVGSEEISERSPQSTPRPCSGEPAPAPAPAPGAYPRLPNIARVAAVNERAARYRAAVTSARDDQPPYYVR